MTNSSLTRRRLLQSGAGALAAAAAARVALPGTASARDSFHWSQYDGRFQHEVRLFAGNYVPAGWKRAPVDGRALLGSGEVPDGPTYRLDERGAGAARRNADGGAATLALTYLLIDEPGQTGDALVGEVRAFPFDVVPHGWHPCDGRRLLIQAHSAFYAVIGDVVPTDRRVWFALPDLRDRTPIAAGTPDAPAGSERGDLAENGTGRRPRLHLNVCICGQGTFPARA